MGVVNLNAKQARVVRAILENVPDNHEIWIHGEQESVFVEEENEDTRTVRQFRVFESGGVTSVALETN